MNNFYDEHEIETTLDCPVCFETPLNAIFMCKTGHHICDKCRKRLDLCPTCQSPITSCRNYLAESLVSKFSIFRGGGDSAENNNEQNNPRTESMPPRKKLKLEDNKTKLKALAVPPGVYKCLLESCRNRKEMGVGLMFKHFESVHTHLYDKFQNNNIAKFSHNFQNFCWMNVKQKYHRVFHVSNMGLFFLNLEVLQDKYINCWLTSPAPVKSTNKFWYFMEFVRENNDEKFTFSTTVASNLQEGYFLRQLGQVFIISPQAHGLDVGQFFSINVKIVHTPSLSPQVLSFY